MSPNGGKSQSHGVIGLVRDASTGSTVVNLKRNIQISSDPGRMVALAFSSTVAWLLRDLAVERSQAGGGRGWGVDVGGDPTLLSYYLPDNVRYEISLEIRIGVLLKASLDHWQETLLKLKILPPRLPRERLFTSIGPRAKKPRDRKNA